jgi:hypothetical protein
MKIINIKKEDPSKYGDNYVYIGRPSKFGNPFKIGPDGSRETVVKKYEEYIRNNKELIDSLPELKGKTLGCFCNTSYELCHGEVLIKLVKEFCE